MKGAFHSVRQIPHQVTCLWTRLPLFILRFASAGGRKILPDYDLNARRLKSEWELFFRLNRLRRIRVHR